MPAPRWLWPDSTIVRVIDGDSIVAAVHRDLGFHGTATFEQRMRLNRINTPPLRTSAGVPARSALTELVANQQVLIETVGAYKYGDEWMAEVVTASGLNVSDELVRLGFAQFWDGNGPRPGG